MSVFIHSEFPKMAVPVASAITTNRHYLKAINVTQLYAFKIPEQCSWHSPLLKQTRFVCSATTSHPRDCPSVPFSANTGPIRYVY